MYVVEDDVLAGLDALQEACIPLYEGACYMKLATTLMLMNMCIVHNCSNKFVDELFFLLDNFLLRANNCLSKNMYFAKTLTQHIGFKYKQIHDCNVGCVLYKGLYADSFHCPKCERARFKQVGHT
jgi:hypothetical protein